MAYEEIFSDEDFAETIDKVSKLLGKESFVLKSKNVALLNQAITQFNTRLTTVENKIMTEYNLSTSLLAGQAKAEAAQYLGGVSEKIRKDSAYKDILNTEVKEIFTYGYVLTLKIREILLNEEIKYSVAYRKGSTSFEVSEEALLKRARLSVSSLQLALKNGQIQIDAVEKVTIGKTLQKDAIAGTVQTNLKGNSLWSRGLSILQTLQANQDISGGSKGLNFGHFYEAYKYFNGKNQNPDAIEYASYMLGLRNPTAFFGGGDYNEYQLKTNESTITHLSTIRAQLAEVQTILNTRQTLKQKTEAIKKSYIAAGATKDIKIAAEEYKNKILDDKILTGALKQI